MKNLVINGAANKPIAIDIQLASETKAPIIIYAHGFNGFKDWGNGDKMGEWFNQQGFHFIKFNFSHNGTTPDRPFEFSDLEAFGNNNFSKQLHDTHAVIDWLYHPLHPLAANFNLNRITLIGHSIGGGVGILAAAKDHRIQQLITWAAIGAAKTPWGKWDHERMTQWQQDGVAYYQNARTGQAMPLYYQLKEDFELNQNNLDISSAAKIITKPWLICHAIDDAAVPIEIAHQLHAIQTNSKLWIGEGGHTFGRTHPQGDQFSEATINLFKETSNFITSNLY